MTASHGDPGGYKIPPDWEKPIELVQRPLSLVQRPLAHGEIDATATVTPQGIVVAQIQRDDYAGGFRTRVDLIERMPDLPPRKDPH